MTDNPSEAAAPVTASAESEESSAPSVDSPAAEMAGRFAELAGAEEWSADHGTAIISVPVGRWLEAHRALRDHLPFFSFLSAVDWAREVAVGDPPQDEEVEEVFQVISRLSSLSGPDAVMLSTAISKEDPVLDSITTVYRGADWHEREAAEMFGIRFEGHPNPVNLYLPDGFEGHPLRKTFPLLSRQVKPWPGDEEVKPLPAADKPEPGGGS